MLSRWRLLHRLVKPAVPPVYPRHFDVENHLGRCLALGVLQRLHTPSRWPYGPTRCRPSISRRLQVHPRRKLDPLRHCLLIKIIFLGTFAPYRDVTILGEITLLGEVAVRGKLGLGCHPWQIQSCHPCRPWRTHSPPQNFPPLPLLSLSTASCWCRCWSRWHCCPCCIHVAASIAMVSPTSSQWRCCLCCDGVAPPLSCW